MEMYIGVGDMYINYKEIGLVKIFGERKFI